MKGTRVMTTGRKELIMVLSISGMKELVVYLPSLAGSKLFLGLSGGVKNGRRNTQQRQAYQNSYY